MTYNPEWNLKWIEARLTQSTPLAFSLANQGVLIRGPENSVDAFTVFEPRDLNPDFFARLRKRFADRGGDYTLVLPKFLEHRADGLLSPEDRAHLRISFSSFVRLKQMGEHFQVRTRLRLVSVDDSPVILKLLKHNFDQTGFIDVVGQISDPMQATAKILALKPDVITMDIQMPGKTGVEVLRELLAKEYFPVVMISSLGLEEGSIVFDALNSGAFDYLQKPLHEEKTQFAIDLAQRVLAAATDQRSSKVQRAVKQVPKERAGLSSEDKLLWVIGASTGGPQALTQVLTSMPTHIPPTLIVQHIPPVYSNAFANSLNQLCPFTVKEAVDGEEVLKDHVYIAAGGRQMGVSERQGRLFLSLADSEPVNRFKPSVDYLFHQVAALKGRKIVAALMTGMGRDGAEGLLELRRGGARTLVQDAATCAVYGMPRSAVELGAAEKICALSAIPETILSMSLEKTAR